MAKVAFLLADGYEDSEFRRPYDLMRGTGHDAVTIGAQRDRRVTGKRGKDTVVLDAATRDVRADEFDALVIAGGHSPDVLRLDDDAVAFVAAMMATEKPVAAICHAASLLIEAGAVRGRVLTSWPSVRTDVVNAGGRWVDAPLVEDGNLITSRQPEDLDEFCAALLKRLGQAVKTAESD